MSTPYALLILLLACIAPIHAAEDIVIRTNITPESVWVGQRMILQIDVLGKDGWAQITDMDALEIPDCYVLPSGNSRVRLQEKIAGADYSGQRYELSLYPQRNGSIEIPALTLPVKMQTWGAGGGTKEQTADTEPFSIEAKLPAGVQNVQRFIASPQFTATQQWSSEADSFTVGDALKRSILLKAEGLPAMLLPPLMYPKLNYLSSYADTPELSDTTEQSPPIAQRSESVTYLFEANGNPELPSYTFQWWNTSSETLQTVTLPGRKVQLTGGAETLTASTESPAQKNTDNRYAKYAFGALTIIITTTLAYWFLIRRAAKQHATPLTETVLFQQLSTQPYSNAAFLQQTLAWVERLTTGRLSLSEFLNTFGDSSAQAIAATLLRDPTHTTDIATFKTGLRSARSQYLKAQTKQRRTDAAEHQLPQLNGSSRAKHFEHIQQ
jgi:hypothetical protein